MTDPIADMLTRIRNAYLARKQQVSIPFSYIKHELAKKLSDLGYIEKVEVTGEGKDQVITAQLIYDQKQPVLNSLRRISSPGRRVYARSSSLKTPLSGYGSIILTTSVGVLTGNEAKAQGVGGEIICEVW